MEHTFFTYDSLPRLAVKNELFDVRFLSTQNITVAFNIMKRGATVPLHEHIHETIDFVQEGKLEMTVGKETVLMQAGMVARVPASVAHSAKALTNCKVINVFFPVREDFEG